MSETKSEILKQIQKLWMLNPQERFGQLLENYVFPSVTTKQGGRTALTFFQSDEETLQRLLMVLNRVRKTK